MEETSKVKKVIFLTLFITLNYFYLLQLVQLSAGCRHLTLRHENMFLL